MVERKYRPHPTVELCHAPLRNVFHSHTRSSTIFGFLPAFPGMLTFPGSTRQEKPLECSCLFGLIESPVWADREP